MPKTIKLLIVIAGTILLIGPASAKASNLKSEKNLYLGPQETIDGNLYVASNNITIDGEIKGDLIAAANTITINGRLEGDLIAAAKNITVNGEINGNVRLAGNSANLNGAIARNVNFIGNYLSIDKNAKIGWDITSAAANTAVSGLIGGNLYAHGNNLILSGKIGKNLNFEGDKSPIITLSPEAVIGGNLNYPEKARLTAKEGSSVSGKITAEKQIPDKNKNNYLLILIYKILAAIVIGLSIIWPGKNIILSLGKIVKKQPLSSLAWGLSIFLALPAISFILIFTVIGLPLAVLTVFLWLAGLYLSKIILAVILGKEISKLFYKNKNKERNLFLPLVIGVLILWPLFSIPSVGWIIAIIAACLGFGAALINLKNKN